MMRESLKMSASVDSGASGAGLSFCRALTP